MKDQPGCSFCGKPTGRISNLIFAGKGSSPAICDECLQVCRKILVNSGTAPIIDPPQHSSKSYNRIGSQSSGPKQLSCSFCGTPQQAAHRLIGSAPGRAPTYICDKCVALGDAAIGGGTFSLGSWIARKMGRQETTIHAIK